MIARILILVGGGIGIGVVGALALGRLVKGLLFGVGVADPLTFAIAALLLAGVAVVAGALPAHRAARVDPVAVLKSE